MEVKKVYVKTRAEFGKQCMFDAHGPMLDMDILPVPADMNDYLPKSHCHVGAQHSTQLALHEAQTISKISKNTGMYHFEGGWPKEINPRDEESTARYRRRVEKDDNWAPKLRKLLEIMEQSVLQNGAVNIYQHYFSDMIPTHMVQPLGLRTVNVYTDPEMPPRPVTNISWSPDSGSRIAVSYCFLDYGRSLDYSNRMYIWQVDNPNEPHMALEPHCPCVVCEFNPRDPSVLASGLMTGQVCNWDIRTGTTPVQSSHLQFSHREYVNAVKWLPTKSNTEFFSTSSGGRAMWWDTRSIREPTEELLFDFETPNEPHAEKLIGVSSINYGPMVGTKFMFGMDNGIIVTGSRKAKTNAEKLAVKFPAHFGPVVSVDRNEFSPAVFMSVGDWTARVWAEDTREGNLVSTVFLQHYPTGGCWNKVRFSVFYVINCIGQLLAWDLLQSLKQPVCTLQLCPEKLTAIAPCEEGTFLAVGNQLGKAYLVESMDFFQSFDKKDRTVLSEFLERCSKLTKTVDSRLKEIRLVHKVMQEEQGEAAMKMKDKAKLKKKNDTKKKEADAGGKDPRKSIAKDKEKKKGREENTDLLEAEQKYNDIIAKEMLRYGSETNTELIPGRQHTMALKKVDKKSKVSKRDSEGDAKATRKKSASQKQLMVHTAKRTHSLTPSKGEEELAAMSETSSKRSAEAGSAVSAGKQAKGKADRRKKRKKISFKLPVPCESEVCRPKVCCWRTDFRSKKRRKRKEKLAEDASPAVSMTKSTDSSTGSLPKKRHRRGRSIFREMLEPPSELRVEVARARRDIAEAWSGGKPRKTYFKRVLKESTVSVVKKVETRRIRIGKHEERTLEEVEEDTDEEDDIESEDEEDVEDLMERRMVGRDPCSPPKIKSTAENFSAILSVPIPTSIEEKIDGREFLKEYAAARRRIYPRISEFRSID